MYRSSRTEECEVHSSDQTDQPPEPKKKKSTLIILLGDDFESDRSSGTNSTSSVKDVVQSEVLRYKSESSLPLEGKASIGMVVKNEHLYPILAIMACKYLCVTATSVPSGQSFSTAGNIVNNKGGA